MSSSSTKPIAIVVLLIGGLWIAGHNGLEDPAGEDALFIHHLPRQPIGRVSRFTGLRAAGLPGQSMGEEREQSALVVQISGADGVHAPEAAKIIVRGQGGGEHVQWSVGGDARFSNLPFNQTFTVEVRAVDGFPCSFEVEGPTAARPAVLLDIPFVHRPLKLQMFGEENQSLYSEWVIVDLFSGAGELTEKHRIPTKSVDKHGFLNLDLFYASDGPFKIRILQDEGKELSLMTRAWLELPRSHNHDHELSPVQLTRPPFFASGKMVQDSGYNIPHVRLRVSKLGANEEWHHDYSMWTKTDYRGRWVLRADYGVDLIKVEPVTQGMEARDDFILPRGLEDFDMRLFPKAPEAGAVASD